MLLSIKLMLLWWLLLLTQLLLWWILLTRFYNLLLLVNHCLNLLLVGLLLPTHGGCLTITILHLLLEIRSCRISLLLLLLPMWILLLSHGECLILTLLKGLRSKRFIHLLWMMMVLKIKSLSIGAFIQFPYPCSACSAKHLCFCCYGPAISKQYCTTICLFWGIPCSKYATWGTYGSRGHSSCPDFEPDYDV